MDDRHERLLSYLSEKTEADSLQWESGSAEMQYILKLSNSNIVLDRYPQSHRFKITILDSSGEIVDDFTIESFEVNNYTKVRAMYRKIDRFVRRVDEKLDVIIEELINK